MPKVMVTRCVHFNAAHRLHNPVLSDEENERIFRRCNNPSFHGHNYELDVSVEGEIDPTTGYIVDLGIVKQIVEARNRRSPGPQSRRSRIPPSRPDNGEPSGSDLAVARGTRTGKAQKSGAPPISWPCDLSR